MQHVSKQREENLRTEQEFPSKYYVIQNLYFVFVNDSPMHSWYSMISFLIFFFKTSNAKPQYVHYTKASLHFQHNNST